VPSDTAKVYAEYYTHGRGDVQSVSRRLPVRGRDAVLAVHLGYRGGLRVSKFWVVVGAVLGVLPAIRRKAQRHVMYLTGRRRGSILDIGCGDGSFLAEMRRLGWITYGIEPDRKAASVARARFGLDVRTAEF
jgi:SAM-dependent methyltransferase